MPIFPVTFLTKLVQEPFVGSESFYISSNNGFDISNNLKNKFWSDVRISDDGQRILAVSVTDIYVSNDAGSTWTRSQAANSYFSGFDRTVYYGIGWGTNYYTGHYSYCSTSSDHQYIYIRGTDGLYVSNNYGSSFSKTYDSISGYNISGIICSANGQNIIATASAGLLKSTDFGQTFTFDSSTTIQGSYFTASDDFSKIGIYSFASSTNYSYVSLDGGTTWDPYHFSFGAAKSFTGVSTSYNGEKTYIASGTNIYTSNNYGSTWNKISISGLTGTGKIASAMLNSNNAVMRAYINFSNKVIKTTDGGTTWSNTNSTIGTVNYLNIDDNATKIHIVGDSKFVVSSNGGNTFAQTTNFTCITGCSDGMLSNVAVVAQNSSSSNNFVYVSTNSGNTWTLKSNSIGLNIYSYYSSGNATIVCDRSTGTKLFARANNTIVVYSLDFGDTWSTVNFTSYYNDYTFSITDIACDSTATNIYVACAIDYYYNANTILFYSNDGGTNWVKKDLPFKSNSYQGYYNPKISCSADGSKIFLLSQYSPVYYSSDYGTTWTDVSSPYKKPAGRVFIARDGSSIAVRDGQVGSSWNINADYYISYDNGNSFSLASNNYFFDHIHDRAGSSNNQILYAAANARVVGYKSYSSWDNNRRYANNSYIWVSNNSGLNWTRANSGVADWKSVDCTPDGNTVVAASSYKGVIYKSTDRGTTWTDISPNIHPNAVTGWKSVGISGHGENISVAADGNNYPKLIWNRFYFPWCYDDYIYTPNSSSTTTSGYNPPSLDVKEVVGTKKELFTNAKISGEIDWWGEGLLAGSNTALYNISYGNDIAPFTNFYANSAPANNAYALGNKNWVGYVKSSVIQEPPYYSKVYLFAAEANGSLYRATYGTNNSVTDREAWTAVANAVTGNWSSVTCTVTGNNVAASIGGSGGDIYISNDKGRNWSSASKTSTANGWTKVHYTHYASHLFATDNGGYIWYSTDKGSTWSYNANAGIKGWTSITASGNGKIQIATESGLSNTGGYIWMSRDFGSTWERQDDAGIGIWWDVATCSDGSYFSAVDAGNNKVWYNTKYYPGTGYQFKIRDYSGNAIYPNINDIPVAMSSNGKYIYTATDGYGLMTSKDYGNTWRYPPYTEYAGFESGFVCSADGKTVLATDGSGLYVSRNYGESFNLANASIYGLQNFYVSSNGQYMIVQGYNNTNFWKSDDYGNTWIELANSLPSGTYWSTGSSVSDDGSKVFLAFAGLYSSNGGVLRLSTDGGSTFANISPPTTSYSNSINNGCMSRDGLIFFALDDNTGTFYASNNNGSTWTQKNRPVVQSGQPGSGFIKTNNDGSVVLWTAYNEYNSTPVISYDAGNSWIMTALTPTEFDGTVNSAMSDDGKTIVFSEGYPFAVNPRIWVYKY